MPPKKSFFLPLALVLSMLACNLPSLANPAPSADTSPTITAMVATIPAQQTPVAAASASPAPTSTGLTVSVSTSTNCRSGPGQTYDVIASLDAGQSAALVGKYTPANYWIVSLPDGTTCWLWGQYATTSGDTSALPEFAVPPTPTLGATRTPKPTPTIVVVAPNAPYNLGYSLSCSAGVGSGGQPTWIEHVTLTWDENWEVGVNEGGFAVHSISSSGAMLQGTLPPAARSTTLSLVYNQSIMGLASYAKITVLAFIPSEPEPVFSLPSTVDVPGCHAKKP